jgi:CHRD domain
MHMLHRPRASIAVAVVAIVAGAVVGATAAAASDTARTFTATLSGDEEVPPEEGAPPVETTATGDATFELSADGTELSYVVNVSGIENVEMGHIHLAARGENGPVVAWLYPEGGPPPELIEGTTDGELASGTLTADDLVDELEGGSIEDLVNEIIGGNAYVNVHTQEYPAGEIRGQIGASDGAIERPDRVDTGAGGTAGPAGAAPLVAVAALAAAGAAAALAVHRRQRRAPSTHT